MCLCSQEKPGCHFQLLADISKAHRRIKHRKQDWGLLGCQSTSGSEYVWLNRVGTFGVGSASYWWGRLSASLGRLALLLSPDSWLLQLLFADDLRWSAWGADKFQCLAKSLFTWVLLGAPFSWGKCRGGVQVDWVGYWLDYARFELGISESRTKWLAE